MITEKDITYISYSYRDPIGRCFVAGERFFRAINHGHETEVLGFLESTLCKELMDRKWLVDTWVAEDVKLSDYNLILEHKKVQAYPWQYLSFEQLRDATLLHVDIENLANQYGYHIKDAGFNNIGLEDGNPIFLDFGSFDRGAEKGEGFMREFAIMYKRLYDMSKLDYQTARALEPRQYVHDVIEGGRTIVYSSAYLGIIHPMVKYYKIHRKISTKPIIYTKSRFSLFCIDMLNAMIRYLLHKRTSWQCFKAIPEYKELSKKNIDALSVNYEYSPQIDVFSERDYETLSTISAKSLRALFLLGNFTLSDYYRLRSKFDVAVYLCTKEPSHADYIYQEAKKEHVPLNVLCGDAKMVHNFIGANHLESHSAFIVAPGNQRDFEAEIQEREMVLCTENK